MENNLQPTFGHGKICYIEVPAVDVEVSAAFYKDVFGWSIRRREDGSIGFDDGVNQVSGSWISGRRPSTEVGMLISIMVLDAEATLAAIAAHGGVVVQSIGKDAPEITAR